MKDSLLIQRSAITHWEERTRINVALAIQLDSPRYEETGRQCAMAAWHIGLAILQQRDYVACVLGRAQVKEQR